MGDHISVVVQFNNAATEHSQGGVSDQLLYKLALNVSLGASEGSHIEPRAYVEQELRTCAWLNAGQWCKQPQGDACLVSSSPHKPLHIDSHSITAHCLSPAIHEMVWAPNL